MCIEVEVAQNGCYSADSGMAQRTEHHHIAHKRANALAR